MYANENAEIALAYWLPLRPVSARIVGERTASTCRSMYDSSVANMIVAGATHFVSRAVRSTLSAPAMVLDIAKEREDRGRGSHARATMRERRREHTLP